MTRDYWLGVATLPALALAVVGTVFAYLTLEALLGKFGWSWDFKIRRRVDEISDYRFMHDIWWERAFGPVFAGGWYREESRYQAADRKMATRWRGLGLRTGPCVVFYRERNLGEVDE